MEEISDQAIQETSRMILTSSFFPSLIFPREVLSFPTGAAVRQNFPQILWWVSINKMIISMI
jgi:hypothetical protein